MKKRKKIDTPNNATAFFLLDYWTMGERYRIDLEQTV